jgi:hypothetical protein
MQRSDTIGKLFAALAKAQLAMDDATKDSANPHFRSKYADLSSVREAIRRPFAENGLAYTQFARFNTEAKAVEVETMLVHGESGEFVSDTLAIPCPQATAHAIGSAITYGRRFSLMAVSGVAPAEDDDGNAASENPPSNVRQLPPKPAPAPKAPPPAPPPAPPAAAPATPSTGYATPPEGAPTAETLIQGIPHYEGLADIKARVMALGIHLTKGTPLPPGPPREAFTPDALKKAEAEWDSWRRSLWPQLSEAEQAKVVEFVDGFGRAAKRLEAVLEKRKAAQAKQVQAAGADPETGEYLDGAA